MIEEAQKECLKSLKEYIDLDPFFNGTKKIESDFDKFCFDHCKDIDNALDIVEKQSKEIERQKGINKEHQELNGRLRTYIKELEEKVEKYRSDWE